MKEFIISIIGSLFAAWLSEKYLKTNFYQKQTKLDIFNERQINIGLLLGKLEESCEEVLGDLREECSNLVLKKKNPIEIYFLIFRRITELSFVLFQTILIYLIPIKKRK